MEREVWQLLADKVSGNLLDPEAVVIGGGIAKAGEALFEPLRKMVSDVEWKVCGHGLKLLPAQLGELAGAYGAAGHSLECSQFGGCMV